jgi:hypothetical protein
MPKHSRKLAPLIIKSAAGLRAAEIFRLASVPGLRRLHDRHRDFRARLHATISAGRSNGSAQDRH